MGKLSRTPAQNRKYQAERVASVIKSLEEIRGAWVAKRFARWVKANDGKIPPAHIKGAT